jgi:hypothetical protein
MRLYSQTIVAQRLKRKAQENTDTQIQTQIVDLEDFSSAHPTQEAASSSARRRLTRARSRLNISLMHATHRLISVIATTTDPLVQGPPMAMQVHQQTCGAHGEQSISFFTCNLAVDPKVSPNDKIAISCATRFSLSLSNNP